MPSNPVVYIDSCCFIDLVKHLVAKLPDSANPDAWYTKQLLQAHYDREIQVITSVLSIVECVGIEPGQAQVPTEVQAHFRRLLTSGQYLSLVQTTPRTGTIGQDLRWKHELVLGGPDAIHLASALEMKAAEFITNDSRLKKPKVAAAVPKLGAAGLKLIRASQTGQLPDKYRQGDFLNA